MSHIVLVAACATLLFVIATQDYLVPLLRQKTISSGLTGPYDGWLLAAFAFLAVALAVAFAGTSLLQQVLATGAAVALVLTGLSGRFTVNIPRGEMWHTVLTAVTFVLAVGLQLAANGQDHRLWVITGGGVLYAVTTHYLVANASVTEKVGVTGLCLWLVAWAL